MVRPAWLRGHLPGPMSPSRNEVRIRNAADAQYRWFLTRAVPLRDARGKILKWYGTSTDIEDRKRAE
jgi:PAS domain-containing protein